MNTAAPDVNWIVVGSRALSLVSELDSPNSSFQNCNKSSKIRRLCSDYRSYLAESFSDARVYSFVPLANFWWDSLSGTELITETGAQHSTKLR